MKTHHVYVTEKGIIIKDFHPKTPWSNWKQEIWAMLMISSMDLLYEQM